MKRAAPQSYLNFEDFQRLRPPTGTFNNETATK
jgi:hypothetical protein